LIEAEIFRSKGIKFRGLAGILYLLGRLILVFDERSIRLIKVLDRIDHLQLGISHGRGSPF
jgi:hypothetical protein